MLDSCDWRHRSRTPPAEAWLYIGNTASDVRFDSLTAGRAYELMVVKPGYKPKHFDFPYWVDNARPFEPGDENAFWFLDFHWSRGLTPLAATLWSADGYCWGTQGASEDDTVHPPPSGEISMVQR